MKYYKINPDPPTLFLCNFLGGSTVIPRKDPLNSTSYIISYILYKTIFIIHFLFNLRYEETEI